MTATGVPVAAPDVAGDPQPRIAAPASARPWRLLLAGCVGLAVLSLLLPSEPTYDPWAWIIWGREITELDLNTVDGPSWKPLPVLFTATFALFGDMLAPNLWLIVARTGGLLAIAMTYRLGSRLGGRWAGVIAAVSLLVADQFIRNFGRGNSEGLLVALCLWAVERHLDGRRTDAFALGVGAALLRPEVWPFLGLYGLWLAYVEPRRRWLVGAGFAACGVLWFVPEWFGSGNFLRAAERARNPNPDSAAFAAVPFVEVFVRSSTVLAAPVLVGAVVALVLAWRSRERLESRVALALGAVAVVLMIGVAAMTQGGFAGNLRYVALPAALVCVLAGLGWVGLVRAAGARWGGRGAAATAAADRRRLGAVRRLGPARAGGELGAGAPGGRLLRSAARGHRALRRRPRAGRRLRRRVHRRLPGAGTRLLPPPARL